MLENVPIFGTAVNWDFLNEPIYRWFIFLGALILMTFAWNGILSLMK